MTNYIYLSSGLFGAKVLANLSPAPKLIITQPEKFGGRGMKTLISTEVKKYCLENKLDFVEISNSNALDPYVKQDLPLVCDFGLIIPESILQLNPLGIWNIHPSLLPKYRGSSPIQTAILNGERETGVTLMQMDEKIDHGPILKQDKCKIEINNNNPALMDKLAKLGAELFIQAIDNQNLLSLEKTPQNHTQATFSKRLTKEDGFIELKILAPYLIPILEKYHLSHLLPYDLLKNEPDQALNSKVHNKIRALYPWPNTWTKLLNDKILKINKSTFDDNQNKLIINEVQIEGKKYKTD